jgi:hypothetical protein
MALLSRYFLSFPDCVAMMVAIIFDNAHIAMIRAFSAPHELSVGVLNHVIARKAVVDERHQVFRHEQWVYKSLQVLKIIYLAPTFIYDGIL